MGLLVCVVVPVVGWEPHSGRVAYVIFTDPLCSGRGRGFLVAQGTRVPFVEGGVWCKLSAY